MAVQRVGQGVQMRSVKMRNALGGERRAAEGLLVVGGRALAGFRGCRQERRRHFRRFWALDASLRLMQQEPPAAAPATT